MLIPFTKRKQKGFKSGEIKTTFFFTMLLFITFEAVSQTVAIPDTNFEQALIDANIDSNGLNGNILEADAQAIVNLPLNNKNINDLTGIEAFVNLTTLVVSNNNLQDINLSSNVLLDYLDCSSNQLSNLDLTSNTALTHVLANGNMLQSINVGNSLDLISLVVPFNNLQSLDISNNTQLETLYCHNNNLTTLDVSSNPNLEILFCYNNVLTELNVTGANSLENLQCHVNNLVMLDVSQNPVLTRLHCNTNSLTYLNIQNGNNSNFEFFTALINSGLTCIQVDDVAYSNANFANIDGQSFFSENCGTTIPIPDTNFEQALIDLGYDTNGLNGNILRLEAEAVTQLDVNNQNISSLEGIQGFVNITLLRCQDNSLTNLDVSSNTNLITLDCRNNQLTSLDLTSNTQLESLNCFNNQITVLDLSNNGALDSLLCDDNQLETLNVKNGNNSNVIFFSALNNPDLYCVEVDDVSTSTANWTFIDSQTIFSENCSATVPIPDGNFEQALIDLGYDNNGLNGNILLYEAQSVNNLDVSNKNISSLEGIQAFENLEYLFCFNNSLSSLDLAGNEYLITLNASNNNLTSISLHHNPFLEFLNISDNQLTNVDVSNNPQLQSFNCNTNLLTELDVSDNDELIELKCTDNALSSLNVQGANDLTYLHIGNNMLMAIFVDDNINLEDLYCDNNNLQGLDLSENPDLRNLSVENNSLNWLDVANGNNTIIDDFSTINNPALFCITVDDATYSTQNWVNIDAQTSFGEVCLPTVAIPDTNFEQALIDLGFDSNGLNGNILLSEALTIEILTIQNRNISSVEGIDAFANLEMLQCNDNNLTTLNLAGNPNLTLLNADNNNLTSLQINQNNILLETLSVIQNQLVNLDISNNPQLTFLQCSNNMLTNIDMSNNSSIGILFCSDNQITSLDINNLGGLSFLDISGNQLTSIDLSDNTNLVELYCHNNQLEELDLTQNPDLTLLFCQDNALNTLDIRNGNNLNIIMFEARFNPELFCISVDDAVFSAQLWTNIDAQTSFSEDCSTLGVENVNLVDFSLYPNPTSNHFYINGLTETAKVEVLNSNGQVLLQKQVGNNERVQFQQLVSGLYFVSISNKYGSTTKKLIVK